jgi:hypothetical protein
VLHSLQAKNLFRRIKKGRHLATFTKDTNIRPNKAKNEYYSEEILAKMMDNICLFCASSTYVFRLSFFILVYWNLNSILHRKFNGPWFKCLKQPYWFRKKEVCLCFPACNLRMSLVQSILFSTKCFIITYLLIVSRLIL